MRDVSGRISRIEHHQRRRVTWLPLPRGGQVGQQVADLRDGGIGVILARAQPPGLDRIHPRRRSPAHALPARSAASRAGTGPRPRPAPAPSPANRRIPHPGGAAASRRSRTSADLLPRAPASPPPAAAAAWPRRSARRPARDTPTRAPAELRLHRQLRRRPHGPVRAQDRVGQLRQPIRAPGQAPVQLPPEGHQPGRPRCRGLGTFADHRVGPVLDRSPATPC